MDKYHRRFLTGLRYWKLDESKEPMWLALFLKEKSISITLERKLRLLREENTK